MSQVSLYLFGAPRVEVNGELVKISRRKSVALLAYLALERRTHSRDVLADFLWPDYDQTYARKNLTNSLSTLSQALTGNWLEKDRATVTLLAGDHLWVDLDAFGDLLGERDGHGHLPNAVCADCIPPLEQAVALYEDHFLSGFSVTDSPDFEQWQGRTAELFRGEAARALEKLSRAHAAQSDFQTALDPVNRCLAQIDPFHEPALRQLIQLYAWSGERVEALRHYEDWRRRLKQELDQPPEPATVELYEAIKTDQTPPAPGSKPAQGQVTVNDKSLPLAETQRSSLEATAGVQLSTGGDPPGITPAAPALTSEQRNQLVLLHKVKNFWVDGVLDQTLQSIGRLEVGRQAVPLAVEQPWEQTLEPLLRDEQPIPPDKSMLDLFQEADRALLILGDPGAGKTISLIELARDLIALAEQDPQQPIPIILNLSSWSEGRRSLLAEWIVAELTLKYQIPHKMGARWLEQNDLVILLDGFDEVELKHQVAALQAINHFRETNGLSGLVVCSRSKAYARLEERLRLGGAIRLQPLSAQQIDDYLATGGPQLSFLRVALQREVEHEGRELLAVLESPLMLSIIRLAYEPVPSNDGQSHEPNFSQDRPKSRADTSLVLQANQDSAIQRQNLFAAYVERMLERRGQSAGYSPAQTRQWLAWLAQKLFQHNQSVFLIEQMQPSWLPSQTQRWLYLLLTRAIEALPIGVLLWAVLLFWQPRAPQVVSQAAGLVIDLLPISGAAGMMLGALLIAQGLSLIVTLFDGVYYEWLERQPEATPSPHIERLRHLIVAGLAGGIPCLTILAAAPEAWRVALYWGANGGWGYALISYWSHGQSFQDEVQAVERLGWSWSGAVIGALLSLIPDAIMRTVALQFNAAHISFDLLWVLTFALVGGLRGRSVERKTQPNQGIRLSAVNSIFAGLLGGLTFAVTVGLTVELVYGLRLGLAGLLIWGGFYGAGNIVKHYTLRLLLWRNGIMPRRYTHFLNDAAKRILLRQVGGGYIFMHRLLQAYFANLAEPESSGPTASEFVDGDEKASVLKAAR